MSAQTNYGFSTPLAGAGGIVDIAPYAIDTFINSENNGVLKFGVGVVAGSTAGSNIKLPVSASTAANFEGITVNNRTTEIDLDGTASIRKSASVGVMRYGRIYARVASGVTPSVGDKVYVLKTGSYIGYVTNSAANAIEVAGVFRSTKDSNGIACIELFNAPAPEALPIASTTVAGVVKVGTGLEATSDGTLSLSN